jgi:hypothetical protein
MFTFSKISMTFVGAAAALFATPAGDTDDLEYQGWATSDARGCCRLIYFNQTPGEKSPWDFSPGQLAIEYGTPAWKDAYETQFDQLTLGKRWRLGQNLWTNLDSRFSFMVGNTEFEPGYYYLCVERSEDDEWSLVFFDPAETFDSQLDAWHVNYKDLEALGDAPLKHEKLAELEPELKIAFQLDPEDDKHAELVIRFGPHRLTADFRVYF